MTNFRLAAKRGLFRWELIMCCSLSKLPPTTPSLFVRQQIAAARLSSPCRSGSHQKFGPNLSIKSCFRSEMRVLKLQFKRTWFTFKIMPLTMKSSESSAQHPRDRKVLVQGFELNANASVCRANNRFSKPFNPCIIEFASKSLIFTREN